MSSIEAIAQLARLGIFFGEALKLEVVSNLGKV